MSCAGQIEIENHERRASNFSVLERGMGVQIFQRVGAIFESEDVIGDTTIAQRSHKGVVIFGAVFDNEDRPPYPFSDHWRGSLNRTGFGGGHFV